MSTKNNSSTRYYSNMQEESICKLLGVRRQPNSGASKFNKGDLISKEASLLLECKTCVSPKDSFSIKKDWIVKNKEEALAQRLTNNCLAFSFGPEQENYFIINERLMKYLIDKLIEDEKDC